jgi:hypothetical protein
VTGSVAAGSAAASSAAASSVAASSVAASSVAASSAAKVMMSSAEVTGRQRGTGAPSAASRSRICRLSWAYTIASAPG